MKVHSYFPRGMSRQLAGWLAVLLCAFALSSARAQGVPGFTGIGTNLAVLDSQSANLYPGVVVTNGNLTFPNAITAYVNNYSPDLGVLEFAPVSASLTNVIQGAGNGFVIGPTNANAVQQILQKLVFTPTNNYIPVPLSSNAVVGLYAKQTVSVIPSVSTNSATNYSFVQITATNDAPDLTASGVARINDRQTTNLFVNVAVTDPDDLGQQPQTVTVTLSATNGFLLVGASGFVSNNLAYTLTNATPDSISNAMQLLTFRPLNNVYPVNRFFTNVFTIVDSDGYVAVTNTGVSVVVYSTNDAPSIAGSGAANINDQQTTNPFVNVTVSDLDESGKQTQQSVTVTLADTNGFLVVSNSLFVSNSPTSYVLTGPLTPAAVTTNLQQLIYQPINNLLPVGTYDTNVLTIVDSDGFGSATNAAVSVVVYSTNDVPVLVGLPPTHVTAYTGKPLTISPFATLNLTDADHNDSAANQNGQDLAWSVTLTGSSSPVGNLQFGSQTGTSFTFTNDQYAAGINLRQFIYNPPSQNVTGTNYLTIAISANDRHGGIVSSNLYVDLSTLVLPVVLSGIQPGQLVYDNSSIAPFANVNIQSRNGNAVNLAVKFTNALNDASGQFINAGGLGFATVSTPTNSTCRLSGSSAAVTAAIRALVFQPVANRIGSAGFDNASFEIDLGDGLSTNLPDTSTSLTILPVNDPPQLSGITAFTSILDSQTATPFSGVQITDVDEKGQQTNVCQINFDTTTGVLTNSSANPALQFSLVGGGYQLTGAPNNLTAGIRQLVFVPTPGLAPVGLTANTGFQIVVVDNHGGQVQNNSTVVRVQSTAGNPIISLPSPLPYSLLKATNVFPFANAVNIYGQAQPFKLLLTVGNVAQGDFTTNSVATNFTKLGGGKYFITGMASNIVTALQSLAFVPTNNLPAGTVVNFTLSVTNSLTPPGITTKTFPVVLRTTRISHIVTQFTDDGTTTVPGTLRNAIANAGNGDHVTFDLGASAAPQVIALQAPIYLNNDLVFDGPGVERLTISGDSANTGTPTTQLFVVNANVTVNRLAFTKGYSPNYGGAFEVSANGNLRLNYCAITDCRADQYGGGVDVEDGALDVEHCLFRGNSTSSQLGAGGGAVSLYTDQTCKFMDTTFATNRQNAIGDGVYTGLGGGALYAEPDYSDLRFPPFLNVYVLNCTFHDNRDAAGHGTAIRPNDDNATVLLQNTIVADGQTNNLELDLSGHVISLGGNVSDDATRQTYSSGGTPVNNYVFHAPLDYTNVPTASLLTALANNGGPTATYALLANGVGVNNAVSNVPAAPFNTNAVGADQRGYFRTNAPDIGAFELGASQKIIIEEIGFNPASANDQFIEFYVPRDSAPLDVGGYQVLVDGVRCHTFTSQLMQPGQALVLTKSLTISVPSGVLQQASTGNLNLTADGSVITVMNANNQIVFEADYLGSYASTDPTDAGHLAAPNQSLVLWPQFQGVFLPYQRVVTLAGGTDTNGFSSPGFDATAKSLGGGNAPPTANADATITDAHTAIVGISVLTNDVDPDIIDTLGVVWVGTNSVVGVANAVPGTNNPAVAFSRLGASLSVNADGTIGYDPTTSVILQSLPQDVLTNDSFQYTILDYSNAYAGPHDRGVSTTEISNNWVKATATVSITVVGVNSAPTPQNDYGTNHPNLATYANLPIDFTTATNVILNDTDPNSDDNGTTLNIVAINATNGFVPYLASITTALGATAVLDVRYSRNQAHISYDPTGSAILRALNQDQTTNDVFYYTVQDRYGAVGTAAISILVRGVNNGPVANPDSLATDENTPLLVSATNFLTNDTDVDNNAVFHMVSVSATSALGAVVTLTNIGGSDYVIYDPTVSTNLNGLAQKEFANDSFTYVMADQWGTNSGTTVAVTVTGVNDHPVSAADPYFTDQNTPLTIAASRGVLSNDYDPDVHDLIRVIPFTLNTVTNCDTSTNGGAPVVVSADGSFTFDPRVVFDWVKQGDTNYDAFNYVVMDHSLSIAADDNFAITAGSSNNVLPVLANDVVLSGVGGAFSIIGVSTPSSGGTVSINASNNTVVYTPLAGFVGAETFYYTNSDGLGAKDWAKVSLAVRSAKLFAVNDSFTVAKGTTNVLNLLANDVIIPASAASISITTLGAPTQGGAVSLNGPGPNNAAIYIPSATNSGSYVEQFIYVITSGTNTATATATITVLDRSNTLVANADRFAVLAGSAANPLDVLANDNNLSGLSTNLFITGVNATNLLGSVFVNGAGNRLVYTPPSGLSNLVESLTYFISDGAGGTAQATAIIQVTAAGFIANNDYFTVIKNSSSNSLPVMVNDVFLPNDGRHLYISDIGLGANAPQHGTVSINPALNKLIYTPAAGYNGNDTFTYEIADGTPSRAQGAVTISILDFSAAPSNPDCFRVARDSTNNLLRVLPNDYTLPPASVTLSVVSLLTNGVHAYIGLSGTNVNNTLAYVPNTGFIGRDVFSYVVQDNLGNLGTNVVTVFVGDLAPRDDAFNVLSDTTNNLLAVRVNDYPFPDTNALRPIVSFSAPSHGTVATNAGGTALLYTPASGYAGPDQFTYQLADDTTAFTNVYSANVSVTVRRAGSDRDTNTVTIAVAGVNDLPTIVGTQSGFHITDKQTVMPFTNVVIGDRDECGYQTNIITVALDNAAKGVLTNLGGFVNIAPGIYQMTEAPVNLTASLKNLVFVPTENRIPVPTSESTRFTITANDGYVVTPITDTNTTVLVDSVNDAPVIAGTQGGWAINDKQTVQPFTNVVITEVDNLTTQTLVVTVSLDLAEKGVLQNLGGFTNAGNGVYAMQGTAANITASLDYLRFVPTENRITVPTTETTTLNISVNDGYTSAPVTNNATTIFVTATNDPSTITGTQGGWSINDKQTVSPFPSVVIADVDNLATQTLVVTVSLDLAAKGVLQNLGGFTNAGNGVYAMQGTPAGITAALTNLVFAPTENRIIVPNSEVTTLTIAVNDGFQNPFVTDTNTTITVASVNDAPTISGTVTNSITDKQTTLPFSTVTVGDVDNLAASPPNPQALTFRIVMDNLDKGSLQNLGGFTAVSNGVLQMVGFAPAITAALNGIVFVPVENHIIVPTTAQIHFALSVDDGFVASPTTNQAAVNVTAVNDAPVITGTRAGQIVYDRLSISPFIGVNVKEVDNDTTQALRCTITLDNASKGFLTNLTGFVNLGGGVYSYGASNGVVTASNITVAISGLVFWPTTAGRVTPATPETTRFTIRVDDFFAQTVVDTNTTVTAIDPLTGSVTANDKFNGAQFGYAVATLRDLAVVGAPLDTSSNSGAVYLFTRSLDGSNTWTQFKKLTAPDVRSGDHFGSAVAVSGDLLVVGSPLNDEKANDAGAAYVFARNQNGSNQWGFVKKLMAYDAFNSDQFGSAVAISNTLVAVGSPLTDLPVGGGAMGDAGAVYVFDQNQGSANAWGLVKKVTLTNAFTADHFGSAVSLSGDNLVVGAPLVDLPVGGGATGDAGAAFIFARNQDGTNAWGVVKRLTLTNAFTADHFGSAVSLSGDNLVVGAPLVDLPVGGGATGDAGAAFIFTRNQDGTNAWGVVKRLTLTNAFTADHFGSAVAIDGSAVVVGVPQADGSGGADYGAVYLYLQNFGGSNTWGLLDKLLPASVGTSDNFGCSVAVSQNTIVAGAYNGLNAGQRYGTAFMFRIFYDNPPQLLLATASRTVQVGVPFAFAIPSGAFTDPDIGDVLTYSVASGPAWLNFNPLTGNFSGTATTAGYYPVNLVATDFYGLVTTNQFTITATPSNPANFNLLSAQAVTAAPGKILTLQFSGLPSLTYRLQQTTNLASPIWTDVTSQASDAGGQIQMNITNPSDAVFYRMVYP
jgi:VCBS repeat-containing protein